VKIHETVDTRAAHFWPRCARNRLSAGGAYSAIPDPLAALRGPISKGRGGVGGGRDGWGGPRGREGWGEERKRGDGREGRGQAPQNSGSRTAPAGHHNELDCTQRAQTSAKAKILTESDPGFESGFPD